jgi:hypothetical protein
VLRAGLRLASGHNRRPSGDPHADVELDQIAEEAESIGAPWLSRLARATRALGPDPDAVLDAYAAATECERRGDRWGHVLATAIACLHEQRSGKPDPRRLARLVAECRELGAGVLQAWAQAFLALAVAADGLPDADVEARAAATLAASAGVPGVHVASTVALARLDPQRRDGLVREAEALAASVGLPASVVRAWAGPQPPATPAAPLCRRPRPRSRRCGCRDPSRPRPSPNPYRRCRSAASADSAWRSPASPSTPRRYGPGPGWHCGCSRCTPAGWYTAK